MWSALEGAGAGAPTAGGRRAQPEPKKRRRSLSSRVRPSGTFDTERSPVLDLLSVK